MHFLAQLSDFFPLNTAFYSFRAQTNQHHPVDLGTSYTVVARIYTLNEDTHLVHNTRDRSMTHSLQI